MSYFLFLFLILILSFLPFKTFYPIVLSITLSVQFFVSANPSTTCCDSISRSVPPDGSAGGAQTPAAVAAAAAAAASFCCPAPYENRLLAGSRSELNAAALGVYGSPYAAAAAASQNYANYFPYGTDPSAAIYSSLVGSPLPALHAPESWGRKGGREGWWVSLDESMHQEKCGDKLLNASAFLFTSLGKVGKKNDPINVRQTISL